MFYKSELKDIAIAVLVLTFIFWWAIGPHILGSLPIFLFVVIISFLFHELAHRLVATKFDYIAFFKLYVLGILFGILTAILFRAIIVAPGVVMIFPKISLAFKSWERKRMELGLIGVAGPLVNLSIAFLFLFIPLAISNLIVRINSILALFNLLPIPPLDGSKVIAWKWQVWLALIAMASLLYFSPLFKFF